MVAGCWSSCGRLGLWNAGGMVASGSGPVVRAAAEERGRRAYELRLAGHSYDEIAELVGFASKQSAHRAVKRWADSVPQPDLEVMRAESSAVLSFARAHTMRAVEEKASGAVRDLVAVEARLAALHGLDAEKGAAVNVAVGVGVDVVGRELLASIHAAVGPPRMPQLEQGDDDVADAAVVE